eukprot:1876663-Prorocentrum_lima.AAC.1
MLEIAMMLFYALHRKPLKLGQCRIELESGHIDRAIAIRNWLTKGPRHFSLEGLARSIMP